MKIRNGFVSNSSSSSFVALIPKTEWSSVVAGLSDIELAAIETLIRDATFCGTDCIEYKSMSGNYNSFDYADWDYIKERALELATQNGRTIPNEDFEKDIISDLVYEGTNKVENAACKLSKANKAFVSSQEF